MTVMAKASSKLLLYSALLRKDSRESEVGTHSRWLVVSTEAEESSFLEAATKQRLTKT
jgi:hypothetical protein